MPDVTPVMTLEALRSVPLFAVLDDEAARGLRDLLEVRALEAGTLLFNKGDAGDAMYLIEDGRVRIFIIDEDEQEVTLTELAGGDFFGEMSIVDGKPRSASAMVVAPARLAVLKRDDFIKFVQRNPNVALEMVSAISERLRRTDELLRKRVSRNVNELEREQMTVADRLADEVSNFSGSWMFILVTIIFITGWILLGLWMRHGQDPDRFPYSFTNSMGVLDAINGCIAALLTPIIVLSQNRQEKKDRLRSDMDFQINLKNELSITEILRRIDVLESERMPMLFAEQNERLLAAVKQSAPTDGAGNTRPS